jgi:hypothetical protein
MVELCTQSDPCANLPLVGMRSELSVMPYLLRDVLHFVVTSIM